MDGSGRRIGQHGERRELYSRVAWALPLLAALLLVTGLSGVARELILVSGASSHSWFILLVNGAIVVVSAASLVVFRRARKP